MGQKNKTSYFTDQFFHTLDDRGRVSIPSEFREIIKERAKGKVVITMDRAKCIMVYPMDVWEKEAGERIKPYLPTDPRVSQSEIDFRRYTMATSKIMELDSHGRLLIPPQYREHAGIEKDVAIVGGGFVFEIWDRGRWEEEIGRMKRELLEGTKENENGGDRNSPSK